MRRRDGSVERSARLDERRRISPRDADGGTARYHVTAPADAALTQPYFLLKPRNGSLYDWPADAPQGMPFEPPLLSASVTFNISGTELTLVETCALPLCGSRARRMRRDVNVVSGVVGRLRFRSAGRSDGRRSARRSGSSSPPRASSIDRSLAHCDCASLPVGHRLLYQLPFSVRQRGIRQRRRSW